MPTAKEVKKLSKEVVLAIDWAAAEYKYLEEFKAELKRVEAENDVSKELRELKKASKLLKYMSKAERRAYRFEEEVGKELKDILLELEDENIHIDLITGFREFVQQFKVEEDMLVKLASFYDSTLEQELDKAKAEAKLEEHLKKEYPKKAAQAHQMFLHLLYPIHQQIDQVEEWIRGLEVTLKKTKELVSQLPEDQMIFLKGMEILRKYGFPISEYPLIADFMAKNYLDLIQIVENCPEVSPFSGSKLFAIGLPRIIQLGFWNNPITWKDLLELTQEVKKETGDLLSEGIPALARANIITPETWPKVMKVIKRLSQSYAAHFFPLYELVAMIPFMIKCLKVITSEKITMVYGIDRGGRVPCIFLQRVLSDLGLSRKVTIYFLQVDKKGVYEPPSWGIRVFLYSDIQIQKLNGSSILLIDEYAEKGFTINFAKTYLQEKGAKVTTLSYATDKLIENQKYYGDYHKDSFGSVLYTVPSWFSKKHYSGVIETETGVAVDRNINRPYFVALRKAILEAADIIADFSKNIDYLN